MAKISVLGAGSWGTALAVVLHKNGHEVTIWSIAQDEIDMLKKEREHKDKLPGVKIAEGDRAYHRPERSDKRKGYAGGRGTFPLYPQYGKINGAVCGGWAAACERGKRDRGRNAYDAFRDLRAGRSRRQRSRYSADRAMRKKSGSDCRRHWLPAQSEKRRQSWYSLPL